MSVIVQLCRGLGVSADWLLGLTDKRVASVSATNSTVAAFGSTVTGGDCSHCPLMLAARKAVSINNRPQSKGNGRR